MHLSTYLQDYVVLFQVPDDLISLYYIPSREILEFPSVTNFDIITSDDINFHFHFLP